MSGASTRLYVGRLAPDTTRDDVADLFNRVGPIVDVRVLNGFGFIEFEDVRDAEYAVRDFDGTMFMGDRIIVQFAKQSTRRERDFERGPRDGYAPRGRRDGPPRPPPRRGPRRGQYRVIVFNLPPGTSWQDLKDVGREHGHVTFAEINPSYPDEGALEFETRDDYERALARIEGTDLRGTLLRAEPAADAPPPPRERSPVRRYRDDYRDDYRDQPRQDYRDQPRQGYRDEYRDDYRDQPQQDYRDQPQQDYRDEYHDQQDYRDQGTGDFDYGYTGQTTQPSPVYEDAAQAFNEVEPLEDTPSRDPYGGAADADWDDMDDVDTTEADDMYPVDKPSFADLDAVDGEPDNKVENAEPKTGGLMGWLRRVTRRGETANTEQYIASMNRKLRQPQVIGIMGSKGGVGKTSKSQVIGSILSHYRTEGGVVAADLDANSTLIQRMKPQTPLSDNASIHTFAHDESIHSAADVNSYLVLNEEKLAVLAGVGMTGSAPLRKDELQRVLTRLGEYYTLIILDFPGSAEVPVAMHALKVIDAMVYVAEITSSSLSATKRDLKRIANVRPELLSTATIILNHRTSGKVHIKNLEGHVEDFRNMGTKDTATGASLVKVFETNFDPHIGIEGPIHISQLDPVNRTRYMQIAASIMDSLPGNPPG